MILDPRRLAVLLNIHRSGGVLAAADNVHVTPSAISQQVARLEEETGVTVLDRQPGGAVLTQAGRILVEAAGGTEPERTEARGALGARRGDATGTVVRGGFQNITRALLAPLVDPLR